MLTHCPACGSKRLARGRVSTLPWASPVAFHRAGDFFARFRRTAPLRAAACADCGHVQLLAEALHEIRDVYEDQRRAGLRLGEEREDHPNANLPGRRSGEGD